MARKAGEWLTGELAALVVATVLGISIAAGGYTAKRIVMTFKEVGDFFKTLADALADGKTSKEELRNITRDGKDVFNVWKDTNYKPT